MGRGSILVTGGVVIGLIVAAVIVLCCVLLKKQKKVNTDYGKTGAAERKILESDTYDYAEAIGTREFTAMITRFPGLLSGKMSVFPGDVILTKHWIRMIQVNSVSKTFVKNNAFGFVVRQVVFDDKTYTKANAAKRAAAGAVIAGAAGAAVGAISAAVTNKNGGIEHHDLTETECFRVAFAANLPTAGGIPEKQYVSCDGILLNSVLMQKLKDSPEVMECIPETNGNYIRMPGIVKNFATRQQAETIAAWLNENLIQ